MKNAIIIKVRVENSLRNRPPDSQRAELQHLHVSYLLQIYLHCMYTHIIRINKPPDVIYEVKYNEYPLYEYVTLNNIYVMLLGL
jgi:hypothetical protein